DLDELAAVEAIGERAGVDRKQEERHPVADDREAGERRRGEGLEDDPVADDVLDVVGGPAEEHPEEGMPVVTMVKRPELGARRGFRGGDWRSTHCPRL